MKISRAFLTLGLHLIAMFFVSSTLLAADNGRIIERGYHHKVSEMTTAFVDGKGKNYEKISYYTTVQNGLYYREDDQWVESKELVEPHPNGATATSGLHKVVFSRNLLAEEGTVDILMPDGKRLRATVLGIALKNSLTGESVWVAIPKDVLGKVVPPNIVSYNNAFDGLKADVVYKYTTAGLEADVVLREDPIIPEGWDESHTTVAVVTEFFDAPVPQISQNFVVTKERAVGNVKLADATLVDEFIDFGEMQLWQGKAFGVDQPKGQASPVLKQWKIDSGRTFLHEDVEYSLIKKELAKLPKQVAFLAPAEEKSVVLLASNRKPALKEEMELAVIGNQLPGYVLDWTLVTSISSFTFQNGITYKIASTVTVSTSTTIESGAIIKFTSINQGGSNGSLAVRGSFTGPGFLQPTAYLTHFTDNTVGEPLAPGLVPSEKYPWAIDFYNIASTPMVDRLEIRHAQTAIQVYLAPYALNIRDCVIKDCTVGIYSYYTIVNVSGTYFCNVPTVFSGNGTFQNNNGNGSTTDCITLPAIVTQPSARSVNKGISTTFTVSATGFAISYQWYHNGVSIPGATSASYNTTATHPKAGPYHVMVFNEAGMVRSSEAVLTVTGVPDIITQPLSQELPVGSTASFTVRAIGGAPYALGTPFYYRWYRTSDSSLVADGPPELVINNIQTTHQNGYYVVIQNGSGSITSQTASLTVTSCSDKVYTLNTDFAKGYSVNLSTAVANELRINSITKPLPFLNVACSARGTVARIDTVSGWVVGEYRTAPQTIAFPNPSRTTVDRFGNVWVANRDSDFITRIGVVIGGTRCDRSGSSPNWVFTPNPAGLYIRPPYTYNTCMDNDADGAIKTSRGLGDILSWSDASSADTTNGGINTTEDEAILNFIKVDTTGTRTLAVDQNNDVWAGGFGNQVHQKINGVTGAILWTSASLASGGYGGVINYYDGERWLWSTRPDSRNYYEWPSFIRIKLSSPSTTFSSETANNSSADYGLAVDPSNQQVWISKGIGSTVAKYPADASSPTVFFSRSPIGITKGLVVDHSANVWIAHGEGIDGSIPPSRTVGHLKTDGTWIGNVNLVPNANIKAGPTGVSMDQNQKVWVANLLGNNVMRINPGIGPYSGVNNQYRIGAVDLTVDLGENETPPNVKAGPYNYSDMTGFVTLGSTLPSGSWVVVQDSGSANKSWNKLTWNFSAPFGSGVTVEARAANSLAALPGVTRLPNQFQAITQNGSTFSPAITGRYLEVRVTLWRNPLSAAVPSLADLTIYCPN